MTLAMFRAALLQLLHDRGALLLSLFVPAVFFLIFAEIFATAASDEVQVHVAIVDEVRSADSISLLAALEREATVTIVPEVNDRATALDLVRRGTADVALIVRADGESLADATGLAAPPLLILVDPSRSVAATVLSGQLQRAYFAALPDLAVGRVAELIGTEFTEFSAEQQAEIDSGLAGLRASAQSSERGGWSFEELLERQDVAGQTAALNHIAYYAGAVAFMFLMFASAQNAVGILDDQAAGILDRIAAGPGGIIVVLNGRFMFLVLQGMVQNTVIFCVAWLLYGVDVPGHFAAWLLISFCAAVLAAGLGLVLVTACRTRAQAQILPTVVILIMSAIGGSMVPRFFMPEWLQTVGWITPNTWALEAYSGLFWRGETLQALLPGCAGLFLSGMLALAISYLLARRLVQR
jgi:ABC-2 type transport system permease protein